MEVGSINLNGKITRMSMLAEGEYFGEVELFLRQPGYSCYARARKKATLLEVSQNFFGGRCERNCVHHSKVIFNTVSYTHLPKGVQHGRMQTEVLPEGWSAGPDR